MQLLINSQTGAITLDPAHRARASAGYTLREATEAELAVIAATGGPLKWTGSELIREAVVLKVPEAITPAQLGVWLLRHNIPPASVGAAIAAIPDSQGRAEAAWRWERSTEIRRSHPLVAALAAALGLSASQTDAAFLEASAL